MKVRKRATPKYGTNEKLPKAFLAVTPNSPNLGILQRTGVKRVMKSGRYKGEVREVIRRLRGPSPFAVFANAAGDEGAATLVEQTRDKLAETLGKNIRRQIAFRASQFD